jgi:aspartate beta-hydroxylase
MHTDTILTLREQYTALIKTLMAIGDGHQAYKCAQLAVESGVWKDPLQRPIVFDPTLPQRPVYDSSKLWFVSYLENQYPAIRDEVLHVVNPYSGGFSPVEDPLLGKGRWDQVVFYERGIRMDRACALFPKTSEIMAGIPDAIHSDGLIMLSWLHPNSHIVPHCGSTNLRLRVHLGIKVPNGACMRVGNTNIVWQEGRCVVFDDSFEHEVWNKSSEPRIVLLFDVAHPELSPSSPTLELTPPNGIEETIRRFLGSRGIARVERDAKTDEVTLIPDQTTSLTITRYMRNLNCTSVELKYGGVVID